MQDKTTFKFTFQNVEGATTFHRITRGVAISSRDDKKVRVESEVAQRADMVRLANSLGGVMENA